MGPLLYKSVGIIKKNFQACKELKILGFFSFRLLEVKVKELWMDRVGD